MKPNAEWACAAFLGRVISSVGQVLRGPFCRHGSRASFVREKFRATGDYSEYPCGVCLRTLDDSEGRDRVAQVESMQIRSRCMGAIGLSVAVGLLACTSGAMSQRVRDKARFVVNIGAEHQVFNAPLVAGQQVYFEFRSLATGAPARVHLRRTENGKPREFDFNTCGRCLKMNRVGAWYVVYVTPVDEDVVVYPDVPGPVMIPLYRQKI